jgi:hypothetical protein
VKEPENDQPISMPSRSTEFVDSHLQKVLYRMEMWVTVPHWAIQMVEGSLNDALVLARIFNWQKYLRRQYKGYLWLEKTHEQLAGEAGMLVPGKPRNRYRRVTRSLERLEKSGLIEKLPPKQEHRNRFTRIRLVTQEFERRMSEIHDENWWAPKGYEV